MADKKVVVVFGAEGKLGGSVARTLARSEEVVVRGVAFDIQNACAQDFHRDNVELLTCDINNRAGLKEFLRDADVCFVNTWTNFDDPNCLETEIKQGCLIADVCKSENVHHVIFSSQLHSNDICSIMARHLVAKAEVEQHMRDIGLPLTCLILPVFYEDLYDILVPKTTDGRTYDIEIPMGKTSLDMISVEDVGQVILTIISQREAYLNKTLSVCGDKITVKEMAQILSNYLRPKVFSEKQLTAHDFHQKKST